jgi:hypothetical protein
MQEVIKANQYLVQMEHLPAAVMALTRNRQSLARAGSHCSSTYDRMLKAHSVMPGSDTVESILNTPPERAHLL